MTKYILILIVIKVVIFMPLLGNDLTFPQYGFSIEPLQASQAPAQVLLMFLPATQGFSPNVNVQIQEFSGTIEEYVDLSLSQFKQNKLELIGTPVIKNCEATFEYSGNIGQGPLHWYARALKKGNKLYLVTATAKTTQWDTVSENLIENVNSFKLN